MINKFSGNFFKYLLEIGVIAVTYFIVGSIGLHYCTTQTEVTLIWPVSGVAIAVLLLRGWRCWPGVFVGSTITYIFIGVPGLIAVALSIGATLEALATFFFLKRIKVFSLSLERLDDVLYFVFFAVLIGPMINAILGVLILGLSGRMFWENAWQVFQNWYIGDAGGVIVVAPLLLAWFGKLADPSYLFSGTRKYKWLVILVALFLITYIVFNTDIKVEYLYGLLIVYAAVNFYTRVSSLLVFLISAIVIAFSLGGVGPLADYSSQDTLVNVVLFLSAISLTGLLASVTITGRLQAEAELGKKEILLNEAQQIAHIGSWELDLQTNQLMWTDEIFRIFGLDPAGVSASFEGFLDAVHPDDRRKVERAYAKSVKRKEPYQVIHRLLLKEGQLKFVVQRGQTFFDSQGNPIKSVGTVQDITEQKKIEEAVIASEDKLRLLLSSTEEPVYGTDLDGVCTFCNQACLRVLGYEKEEDLLGRNIHKLIHHSKQNQERYDIDECPLYHVNFSNRGCHADNEFFWRADGSCFPVEVWAHPQIKQGKSIGSVVVFHDITQRKKTELALQKSEEKFRLAFASISDALFISELDTGIIIECNERLFGYRKEEMLSKSAIDLFWLNPSDRQRMVDKFNKEGKVIDFETMLRRKDNSVFIANITTHLMDLGDHSYIFSVIRDFTSRKQAEEALLALNEHLDHRVRERTQELEAVIRELEAFSYSISHDLRGPLRSIDGLSKIVLEDNADRLDHHSKAYLDMVRLNAEKMADVIDDLQQYSRLNRVDLNFKDIDLSEMVIQELQYLQSRDPGRKHECKIARDLHVRADENLIRILVENVVGNAWKFSSKVSSAMIEFGQVMHQGLPVFFVRDNGIGFDMKYAPKIFKPFQRLQGDPFFSGTGIGLAIVERIVVRHGGKVWAEGQLKQGATIYFSLTS